MQQNAKRHLNNPFSFFFYFAFTSHFGHLCSSFVRVEFENFHEMLSID